MFSEASLPVTPEYTAVVVAAVVACVLLLWNFILKKRLVKYRYHSSHQGERYRQFFENCPDALLVVEHEGSIVSANSHACGLLKMDGQDLLARTFWSFITGVSRAEFQKQFTQCLSGKPMRCEGSMQDKDGSVIPVEVNGSLQHINGKKLVQLYVRDTSVLKEVEDQVRSLYNQLEEVTVAVGEKERVAAEEARLARKEFNALLNHQIRTPLDGIMGMAQLLYDTPLNIEQHNCVKTILNASSNLLDVIRDISEAPDDAGDDIVLQAESVNLRALCETLSIKYEPLAAHKGIDFRCDCQSNVPRHVVTDGRLLSRALSNLLDNAIRYTEQGLVMLNIECRRKNNDEAELYFHVVDTGMGIDKEFHSLVFEKSVQIRNNRFTRCEGSGLGLAASSQVVELMGGTIGLVSTIGKGSSFYFGLTFPLALPQTVIAAPEKAKPANVIQPNLIRDALILVVDDNKISQKVVSAMLRKAGCEVDAVSNGKEALSQIRRKPYDVILMDCQMPVMDGFEATASIRSMSEPYRSIPIVALTAHTLRYELQACLKSGMDDCIVKPIEHQKLIETVNRYTQKSSHGTALEKKTA